MLSFTLNRMVFKLMRCTVCIGFVAPFVAAAQENPQDALESIERTRGGRHWIDAKTAPAKTPQESLNCLEIEPGLEIQLVAAEPLVMDPVAIAFDELGQMFVVEYGDYPTGPPQGGDSLSRVVMLEDTDGDGRMDRRHLFAEKLTFAHSLMPLQGGLLVGAQSQIVFLKDTTGDHKADVREVWFDGFKAAHPQMQIGNPRWGMDNWISLNYGIGKITSKRHPGKPVDMPRADFRFHPLTHEFGPDSGTGQFGNTFDNWGNRFFCTNRNPIIASAMPLAVSRRNPFAIVPRSYYDVAPSGGDTRVYPLVEMKSNYLSHAGTHTSACGVTAYRGDLLGAGYQRSVMVCEPIGHLVTHSIVKPRGAKLTAERARPKADFVASTDTWFRPASLANGPDGALYLADMYRLWVEHPKFLPPEIAKRIDWRAGEDRGRVYRIAPKGAKSRSYTPPKTSTDLVALLSDPNGWRRQLGQRLLVERQAKEVAPALRGLLAGSKNPVGRLHALWTLDGLGALSTSDIAKALTDQDARVRSDAIKLAAGRVKDSGRWLERLAPLAADNSPACRYQAALALGESDDVEATKLLTKIALRDSQDAWIRTAILTSSKERSGAILAALVSDTKFSTEGTPERIDLVRQLATVVGARGDIAELALLLNTITSSEKSGVWWQTTAMGGLATGLPRHRGALGKTSLPRLLSSPPMELAASAKKTEQLLNQIGEVAVDSKADLSSRVAAISLLGYRPFEQSADLYRALLTTAQPVEVQLACINTMRASGNDAAAKIVLDRWTVLGPTVRGPALDLLVRRSSSTLLLLEAISEGKITSSAFGIDQRVRLLKHSDAKIRSLATKLLGGAVSSNRRKVAMQYKASLDLQASSAEGAKVFKKTCSKCHVINGQGHKVGPDISDVRNRSYEALLYDILDPNSKVEPKFTDYTIATDDGRVLNGLMISETPDAVVLGQAEGKQQVIARAEIEEIRASGKSLMPEGVEKEITLQQMADLLEFLKTQK